MLALWDRDLIALLVRASFVCGLIELLQNLGTVFAAPDTHSSFLYGARSQKQQSVSKEKKEDKKVSPGINLIAFPFILQLCPKNHCEKTEGKVVIRIRAIKYSP
jgi:hypothetical protein